MPSGLLHDESIIFYHPLDDLIEYTKGLAWSSVDNHASFVPGLLVSGIKLDPGNVLERLYYPASTYDSVENASGITTCMWVSGFLTADTVQRLVEVGIGQDGGLGNRNKAIIYKTSTTDGFNTAGRFDGTFGSQVWTPAPSNDTDWHFFVVDLRYEGTGWRHRISFDGAGWLDLGVNVHGGNITTPDSKPLISINDSTTATIVVDEVVFWGNNNLFTSQELSNLYELYNTHSSTMDKYISIFGTPINSGMDCFIKGKLSTSGNTSLYIPSQFDHKQVDLFISGIPTYTFLSGSLPMYLPGLDFTNYEIDLYISGPQPAASSLSLYTKGPIFASDGMDNFTEGHLPSSGECTLFIQGGWTANAFVAVVANNPSSTLGLFLHGSPSGVSNLSFTGGSATLYIKDDGINDPVDITWPAFVGVADSILIPHSGLWSSFVSCGNTANNNIDFYTYGHASGSSVRGSLITGSFNTFIEGLGSVSGDEGLLWDGFYSINSNLASFTRVHSGIIDTLSFYTSGSIPFIPPSATLNLFTFGIRGITSSSSDLHMYGNDIITNSLDYYIFGIIGRGSGSIQLHIEGPSSGLFTEESDLYTHGY